MAKIGKKDAQGSGSILSWFVRNPFNVATKAGSLARAITTPKKDRAEETDSSRPTTPPTSSQNAQTDDASMRGVVGSRELKGLGSAEEAGSLEGRKRTRTPVSTFSPNAKSSPRSHTARTPVPLRTLRVPIEQEKDGSGNSPQFLQHDKEKALSRQSGKQQLDRENESEVATKRAIALASAERNGSPRIARIRDAHAHAPLVSSPLSSPSKPRPSKRRKPSESPVSKTSRRPPQSKVRKEKSAGSDWRPSTPTGQRKQKELQPGSRSSSRLIRNASTNRNKQTSDQGREAAGERSEEDGYSGKPVKCTEYHKGYSRNDNLLRRQRNAHGEPWNTPRRGRQSQTQTDKDVEVSESVTPTLATRSRKEHLATLTKASPQNRDSSPLSSASRRLHLHTKQLSQSAEMPVSSPTSNPSLKRKRGETVEVSRSQPRRSARPESYASPTRLSAPASARKSQSPKPRGVASSSIMPAPKTTPKRKRKRDPLKASAVGIRPSPRDKPTSSVFSPISPVEESQPDFLAEVPRQRSSSLSSEKTVEDVYQSPREDFNRTPWPAVQSKKSSRSVSDQLREEETRGPSASPLSQGSPEPNASLSLPIPEKTSNIPTSTISTSFSSLLRSSQPSKRVVSHGKEVVLGSDDDDSDGSLPDLDQLLGHKRKTNTAPKFKAAEPEPQKKYAFSLDALLQANKQQAAAEARIEAAKSRLQVHGMQDGPIVTRESAMACLVENADQDEGNARRVREAFRRTEACDLHEVWHFFDEKLSARSKHAFPVVKTFNKVLASILNDPAKRHQALVTGFLTRLALHTALPREVLLWMMEEVCREPKEVLVQSYIKVLEASLSKHEQIVDPTLIGSLFKQIGACGAALSPGSTITASQEPVGDQKRPISSRVHILVTLLESLAKHMDSESRGYALRLLALASFDDSVVQDGHLSVMIEKAIDTLLKSIPHENFEQEILLVGEKLFDTVKSPVLRHQLISALPCYSSQTHRFRRQLAFAFALNSLKHLESSLDNSGLINHVFLSLQQSKHYRISKKTDYTITEAYFSMLDVAIDVGFSDCNFAEASPTDTGIVASEEQSEGSRKSLFAPQIVRKAPVNLKEKAFNEDVDALAKEIRDIMSLILDSGASDMSRTECKATAGRVVKRLENGVRTKVKPTKDWYNRNDQGKSMMEGFVRKGPVQQAAIAEESQQNNLEVADEEVLPDMQGQAVQHGLNTPK